MSSKILVDEVYGKTANTAAMTIDSTGRVALPQVPSWRVSLTSSQSVTTSGYTTIQWSETSNYNCFLQGGVTLSSYKIIVPVSGVYQCNFSVRLDGIGSGFAIVVMVRKDTTTANSETYQINGSPPTNYVSFAGSDVYKLDANDDMKVDVYTSADTSYTIQSTCTFSGHLVG